VQALQAQAGQQGERGAQPDSPQQQPSIGGLQGSGQQQSRQPGAACAGHEGMVLVAVLLCSLLRGCRLQGHKARVVALLRDAAAHCDDDTRLQRLLPFLVAATTEPLAAVRAVALRAVAHVLGQVRRAAGWGTPAAPAKLGAWHGCALVLPLRAACLLTLPACCVGAGPQVRRVPPSEAKVFNEYVLPSLSLLPTDSELLVQASAEAGREAWLGCRMPDAAVA
jgi:hypothetical protein